MLTDLMSCPQDDNRHTWILFACILSNLNIHEVIKCDVSSLFTSQIKCLGPHSSLLGVAVSEILCCI